MSYVSLGAVRLIQGDAFVLPGTSFFKKRQAYDPSSTCSRFQFLVSSFVKSVDERKSLLIQDGMMVWGKFIFYGLWVRDGD